MEITVNYWPLIVLFIGIVLVIVFITVLRIHAFIALILTAITVGLLSEQLPESNITNHFVRAVELTMVEFGKVAGQIAWVIALASVLGVALTESGAAERIVNQFVKWFGERYTPLALLFSGFVLSIPVFFDTVFFLLIPIAYSMGRRMKQNYMLYVLTVGAGAAITHALVPPTPGPLIMAETLQINLGLVIMAGILMGIIPSLSGYLFAQKIKNRFDVSPPDIQAEAFAEEAQKLPSFFLSMLPIVVPLLLIIFASVIDILYPGEESGLLTFIGFVGNKNMAMLAGTILALWLLARQKHWKIRQLEKVMERPLEIAGLIILITGAGGAFGAMIRNTGIGETIQQLAGKGYEINLILLAWLISATMKIAQGSSTVAMITTSGIMVSLLATMDISYHPVYILMAIGFGSHTISWMNDSGFWVVGKLSGFTENQTLRSWTVTLVIMSVVGLLQTLLLSYLLPLI